MGYEYRLKTVPPVQDLETVCVGVFDGVSWNRIPTSYRDIPGIGVQCGRRASDPSWPHVADLHNEGGGSIFVVCHSGVGRRFLEEFVAHLEDLGYTVDVDDDV